MTKRRKVEEAGQGQEAELDIQVGVGRLSGHIRPAWRVWNPAGKRV